MQDKQQASQYLMRQIIDQLIALIILLVAWMNRAHWSALWMKVVVIVAIVILAIDYLVHSPRLPKRQHQPKAK